jgi:hypothetical protein
MFQKYSLIFWGGYVIFSKTLQTASQAYVDALLAQYLQGFRVLLRLYSGIESLQWQLYGF